MAPALRLFWPTPGPRHLGEGGPRDSSLLVGWWRESNRAGGSVDVVVAGVVRRAEDLRPIAEGAGRWVDAPRYEGLGPPTLIGRVSGDDGKRVDVPSGSKGGPWIEASRHDDGIPRIDATSGVDASRVLVVLHDPPRPPMRRVSVRSVAAGARARPLRDEETGLEWATRAMELGGRLDRSDGRDETSSSGIRRRHRQPPSGSFGADVIGRAARAVGHAAGAVARVLDAKVIPGVLNTGPDAHQWRVFGRGAVRWRDACEVFAVFAVVRSRARSVARSCLGGHGREDAGGLGSQADTPDEAVVRRSVAAAAGWAVLIASDVALGFLVADFLVNNVDAVASFAMGGTYASGTGDASTKDGTPLGTTLGTPLGGAVVSANAEWITRGSPLGIKLHVPLATFLAELATTMVDSLSVAMRTRGCRALMRGVVRVVAWSGRIGGLSLQAALAADVTTFLTTHLAALHVYSSLLVTAQVAAARRLYLLVSPPRKSLPEEDPRPEDIDEDIAGDITMHGLSKMEGRVFGTLALAPVALLLPTTVAFYLSYLALHALTVFARAAAVLVSATLQHPRMDLVALRLCHPDSFPGGVTIDAVSGSGGPRVARLRAQPAPWHAPLAPFAAAAAGWTGGLVGAVARACGGFGRLPVAVVPFEPARVIYFD